MFVAEFHVRASLLHKLLRAVAAKLWNIAHRSRVMVRPGLRGTPDQQWRDLQSRGTDGGIQDAAARLACASNQPRHRQVSSGTNQRSRPIRARPLARPVAWRREANRSDRQRRRQGGSYTDSVQHSGRNFAHRGLFLQLSQRSGFSASASQLRFLPVADFLCDAHPDAPPLPSLFVEPNGLEPHRRVALERLPAVLTPARWI